jgi:UDP-N-acetylglucosamine 1-carboxyvinyltransferase
LSRFGKVSSVFPGGDKIGERELKAHFHSLIQLGARVSGNEWGNFELESDLQATTVYLYEPSVTATENVIMAASRIESGTTVIKGAACEPHVQELCTILAEAGVEIDGIGSNVLRIKGKKSLSMEGRSHKVWPDYIDVSTTAVAAGITGGEVKVKNVRPEDLVTIRFFFDQLGFDMQLDGRDLLISSDQKLKLKDKEWGRIKGIYSQPWYSFPSDLMSIAIVLAMNVEGSTLFFEKLYRDRMSFSADFNGAGANIIQCDPHRIVVNGPTELRGHKYHAPDLRAGMAYFLAGLMTDGVTEVSGIEHIQRGYPNTVERYNSLGADVELVE